MCWGRAESAQGGEGAFLAGCVHWAVAGCVGGAFEEWQNRTDWLEVSLHSFTSQHRAETDAKPGLLPFHSSHVEGSNCVQGTSLPRWKISCIA